MRLKGRTAEATLRVDSPGNAESALQSPEADLPAVLPISRLIALMESAAARLMRSALRDGESSVAVEMNLTHAAPKRVHGAVRAVAAYRGVAGRVHRFTVHAFDESGLIASAEHTRVIVIENRTEGFARQRLGRRGMQLAV